MKKNILLILLSSVLLAGCTLSDIFPWGKKDDESEQKTPVNPGGNENLEDLKNPYTATLNFYGSYLPSEWTGTGVNLDSTNDSQSTNNDKLVNVASSQIDKSGCLSELFFTKLGIGAYEDSGFILQIGTGNPANSNFNPGEFTWTSTKKIYRVDVTAHCYKKELGATDSSARLRIDAGSKGTDTESTRPIKDRVTFNMDLSIGSEETPIYKSFSNTFTKGAERFSLVSQGGRVFLQSISITWDLG